MKRCSPLTAYRQLLFLNWCIDNGQYLGGLSLISVYVMGDDGVVVDAVALFEQVRVLAVADFHRALHHHDELFAFVRGKHELVVVRRSHGGKESSLCLCARSDEQPDEQDAQGVVRDGKFLHVV